MTHRFPFLETVPAEDNELILVAGKKLYDQIPKWIWARPLGRFGYSGARLYVVRVSFNNEPKHHHFFKPFAIKIAEKEKIYKEKKAYASICNILDYDYKAIPSGENAALATKLHDDGKGVVTDLTDLLRRTWQLKRRDAPPESIDLAPLFTKLYENRLQKLHLTHTPQKTKWSAHYGITQDKIDEIDVRLRGLLGSEIVNLALPKKIFNRIIKKPANLFIGQIHGDLHPSNVVYVPRAENAPSIELIDFADARQDGHLLKDFVLMECSVRFHRFPRFVNFETQRRFDHVLSAFDFDPCDAIECVKESPLQSQYEKLAHYVHSIRNAAITRSQELGCNNVKSDYLTALFLQLYHQMRYETYGHSAGEALIQMAKKFSN